MIYPGEYPEGLVRTTNVQCAVVGGYVTARLQVQGEPVLSAGTVSVGGGVLSESGYVANTTMVTVENTGLNSFTMRLLGTNDYTSGPRENIGAAQTLVPLGRTQYSVVPRHTYLEVFTTSGTSALKMQLSSRLKWDELGFAKTDPFYPPFLWNVKNPITSAVST
jgi:hypothetical protein